MKPARFLSLAFFILIFAFSTFSYADVPQMINYQGKITTTTGALVDTTVQMIFTIYDDSTDGGVLWADTLSSVMVEKGIFSVLLGSGNPLPDSVFNGSVRYLGTKVGSDLEMSPRKEIVSVAYALLADSARVAGVAVPLAPGVNSSSNDGSYSVTGSYTDALSVTINVPGPGYVVVTACGIIFIVKTGSHECSCVVSVSETSGVPDNGNMQAASINAGASNGNYRYPFSITEKFQVDSAGEKTFYLVTKNHDPSYSNDTLGQMQITAIYFSTQY